MKELIRSLLLHHEEPYLSDLSGKPFREVRLPFVNSANPRGITLQAAVLPSLTALAFFSLDISYEYVVQIEISDTSSGLKFTLRYLALKGLKSL